MKSFEVNQSYEGRFINSYDSTLKVTILKRTPKTVTIKDPFDISELKRCKVHVVDGSELIYPMSQGSMALTISASGCVCDHASL